MIPSKSGAPITVKDEKLLVPNNPIIGLIDGDGVGVEVTTVTRHVIDAAVKNSYNGTRKIAWRKLVAGKEALQKKGDLLPSDTLQAIEKYRIALKGPLETPIGKGYRSVNVAIRQTLNLFACVRPVKHFPGVPSPVRHPEKVDMIVFRENLEDLYAGIEWEEGSRGASKVIRFLNDEMGTTIPSDSGVGIKPMSIKRTKAIMRAALDYCFANQRRSITLVTKGNIMKYTEGAFRTWGYEVAMDEYGSRVVSEKDLFEKYDGRIPEGKTVIKDRLADNMLQQILLFPEHYDIIVAPNLNGDYISDALAAQVGGLGMTPGANLGNHLGVFEATHGTAPDIAGKGIVNPTASILSGKLMLEYMGWSEAATVLQRALEKTIAEKKVTVDLATQMNRTTALSTNDFEKAVLKNVNN